jgi:hypothetical protein
MEKKSLKNWKRSIKPIIGSLNRLTILTNFLLDDLRKNRTKIWITKIRNESGDIFIRSWYEQLYGSKLFGFWDKLFGLLFSSTGWFETHYPSALASPVLKLQACVILTDQQIGGPRWNGQLVQT